MVVVAEGETRRFCEISLSIIVSLGYSYIIGKTIPKGCARLMAVLPIIAMFLALPLKLTSVHLRGMIGFFISWLANFKLLLFAFGKSSLSFDPSVSFSRFLALACLPIELQHEPQDESSGKSRNQQGTPVRKQRKSYSYLLKCNQVLESPWILVVQGMLVLLITRAYVYERYMPQMLQGMIYLLHIYVTLDFASTSIARAATISLGLNLKNSFNRPLASTSLQDFWSKRWNLMTKEVLRHAVYLPARAVSTRLIGRRLAPAPASLVTFLVSGLMHELMFFYLDERTPTFEVTGFFLVQGICVCVEVFAKDYVGGKLVMPWLLSVAATLSFIVGCCFWLFLPPLFASSLFTKVHCEFAEICNFINLELQSTMNVIF